MLASSSLVRFSPKPKIQFGTMTAYRRQVNSCLPDQTLETQVLRRYKENE